MGRSTQKIASTLVRTKSRKTRMNFWNIVLKVMKLFFHHVEELLHVFHAFIKFLNNMNDVEEGESTRWCMRGGRYMMKLLTINVRIIHSMKNGFFNDDIWNTINRFLSIDIYLIILEGTHDDKPKRKNQVIFQGYFHML